MRIIIAPDSFKGSLTATEACEHIEKGIKRALPGADTVKLPVSDGGEGLVDVMVTATGGNIREVEVNDPLGRKITSHYGVLGNGTTAVIEMAAASGLTLLSAAERDPLMTSTYGTGQLIKAALDEGMKKMIIGIGDSATVDGGTGMAAALGARFLDTEGSLLPQGGGPLDKLESIDTSGLDPRLEGTEIDIACDVDNPLTGDQGAARIYAPQKGATPPMVDILELNLTRLAAVIHRDLGIDIEKVPGSGAAGGLGAGLIAFTGGRTCPGVELVLDNTGFDEKLGRADLVISGEGRVDPQTFFGKAPVGVSMRAAKKGCPVILIGGSIEGRLPELHEKNIVSYFGLIPHLMPEEELYGKAGRFLETAAEQVMRTVLCGRDIEKTTVKDK